MSSGSSLARKEHVSFHLFCYQPSRVLLLEFPIMCTNAAITFLKILLKYLSTFINCLIYFNKYCQKYREKRKTFYVWNENNLLVTFSTHIPLEPTSSVTIHYTHSTAQHTSPLLLAVLLQVIKICTTDTAGIPCTFQSKPHNKYQLILLFHDYDIIHTWIYCNFKYLFYSGSLSLISSLQPKRM